MPYPISPGQRHRLRGVRLAGPGPLPEAATAVQRRVSSRGGIQVARQRIQVGMTHSGKVVTVLSEDTSFRLVIGAETVRVVPRTTSRDIGRYKAYATRNRPADPHLPRRRQTHARPETRCRGRGRARRAAAVPGQVAGPRSRPPRRLLEEFAGHPAYNLGQLRQDLDRFTFLLGGDDGESLFGHSAAE